MGWGVRERISERVERGYGEMISGMRVRLVWSALKLRDWSDAM
jgi:hypothetical protein